VLPKFLPPADLMGMVAAVCEQERAGYYRGLAEEGIATGQWLASRQFQTAAPIIRRFGFLSKQGKLVANWKRRFVVLTSHSINYYPKPGVSRHLCSSCRSLLVVFRSTHI
jgi:hypothetical protein